MHARDSWEVKMQLGLCALLALIALWACSAGVVTTMAQVTGALVDQAPTLTVQKLRNDLFVLRPPDSQVNSGVSNGVFIRDRSVLIIDVRGGWGQSVRDATRALTSKPIETIINTHAHPGHVNGNPEGFPASTEIIAHANAAARMAKMPAFVQSAGRGLPTRTFTDRLTVGQGTSRVELYYFGRGHTDGDAWVVIPAARTLYVDIFPGLDLPGLDRELGGSGLEMPATLERAVATLQASVDTIITAHGPVLTMKDLRDYAAFNREFLATVVAAKRQGRSVSDVANAWKLPARYAHYNKPTPGRVRANVEIIFAESK